MRRKGAGRRRTRTTVAAVDGISFRVEPGESVGYIGANGAGKSTTIKMLTGILVPTVGHGAHLRPRPGAPAPRAGPPDRRGLRPAHPAVVGPAAARVVHASSPRSTGSTAGAAAGRGRPSWSTSWRWASSWTPRSASCRLGQRMRGEIAAALLHSPELLDPGRADHRPGRAEQAAAARVPAPRARARTAPRCCSPPTTWATSSGCATGSWSSTTARLAYDGTLPGLAATGRRATASWSSTWPSPRPDLAGIPRRRAPRAARAAGLRQRLAFDARGHDGGDAAGRGPARVEVRDLSIEEPDIEDVVPRIYQSRR